MNPTDILPNTYGLDIPDPGLNSPTTNSIQSNLMEVLSMDRHGSVNNDPNHTDLEPNLLQLSPYVDLQGLINSIKAKNVKNKLNILSLNCASINARHNDLNILIEALQLENITLHVICVQETWLGENDDTNLLQLQNYEFIHKPKYVSPHGGLGIYVHESLKFKANKSFKSTVFENQVIEIGSENDKKIILCNIYRAPINSSASFGAFQEEFTSLCSTLHKKCFVSMILGDFNVNCLEANVNANVRDIIDSAISSGYIPKITLPTRYSIQYGSYSLIDNILLKSIYDTDCYAHVLTHKLSDHFGCFVSLKLKYDFDVAKSPKQIGNCFFQ